MPFKLKAFPKQMPVTAQIGRRRKRKTPFPRDKTRLLVAFKQRMERHTVTALLDACQLKLEDAGEREVQDEIAQLVENNCKALKENEGFRKQFSKDIRARAAKAKKETGCFAIPDLSRRVAHTASRYWVRSDESITQDQVDQLVTNSGNKVRWIAPVYGNPDVRNELFSPLPHALIVEPAKSVDEAALAKKLNHLGLQGVKERSRYLGNRRYVMLSDKKSDAGTTVYGLRDDLLKARKRKMVQDAWLEIIPLLSAASAPAAPPLPSYSPDDYYYVHGDPWNLTQILAEKGWGFLDQLQKTGTTLHPVTICILDSDGVDLQHEEFRGRVVDAYTVPGADTDPANPLPPGQADQEQPHGTLCAGVAVATANNKVGLAGLAGWPDIFSLMPIRTGESLLGWASGIRCAADYGADVISISMNPALDQETAGKEMDALDEAIAYAVHDKKVVICVSSGNDDHTSSVQYPASHPDVIACGAVNYRGERCKPGDWPGMPNGGSSHGDGLSVVAPGHYITTTTTTTRGNGGYVLGFKGTSAAAPHVAGLAALILSIDPNLHPTRVKEIIEKTADLLSYRPGPTGKNNEIGYGLINVYDALNKVYAALT